VGKAETGPEKKALKLDLDRNLPLWLFVLLAVLSFDALK
jgi:hypothetical protein